MKRVKKFFISLIIIITGICFVFLSLEYRLPWLDWWLTEIGFGRTVRAVYDPSDPSKTLALSGVIISAIGLLAMVDALRNKNISH